MDIERGYYNLGYLDSLAYNDSFIHGLDPRTKILATGIYVIIVVSYPKYEINGLLPLFFYPMLLAMLGEVPWTFIFRKLLYLSPFPILIAVFNPIMDREPRAFLMGIEIWGGWLSFASIMLKFSLTTSAALLLIATTSFPALCAGLQRLAVPGIFVVQLMFIYRYIFILIEEGMRMVRARALRMFNVRRLNLREFVSLAGVLFVRTYERADRVYRAMLSRGFEGSTNTLRELSLKISDWLFIVFIATMLVMMRIFNMTHYIGNMFFEG